MHKSLPITLQVVANIDEKPTQCPIRKLPFELLSKIFVLSISDSRSQGRLEHSSDFPLTFDVVPCYRHEHATLPSQLARVCLEWRDTAYAVPQLWTTISVDFTILPNNASHAIDLWLQRSKPFPLSVELFRNDSLRSTDGWEKVVGTLLRESSRWRHLQFRLFFPRHDHDDDYTAVEEMMKSLDPLPALESVEFYPSHWTPMRPHGGTQPETVPELKPFLNAPTLRSITMRHDIYLLSTRSLGYKPTWSSLEHLTVSGKEVELDDLLDVLHHEMYRGLKTLVLQSVYAYDYDYYDDDVQSGVEALVLPLMSSFCVMEYDRFDMRKVLHLLQMAGPLVMPSLSSMYIIVCDDNYDRRDSRVIAQLCGCIQSFQCTASVTTLHLQGPSLDVIPALHLLFNLHTLSVIETQPYSSTIDDLCGALRVRQSTSIDSEGENIDGGIVVPKLQHLSLKIRKNVYRFGITLPLDLVLEVVKSRWPPDSNPTAVTPVVQCLLSLDLLLHRGAEEDVSFQSLREIGKAGFQFTYQFLDPDLHSGNGW
ncbi:hypothetical protein D9758_013020 [Tetrapyrgos nigripes]|uniref:F-box domain-containing protein n=1 Tax=Tetrapyrgos nigripes TaxID=182062 RepID=A0A8H5C9C7_9AGAR|nr:hypothetical protein D9758_013020 [Tetrapyrgos nigripes]